MLRSARIHNGDDCELLTPQRARCQLPVHGAQRAGVRQLPRAVRGARQLRRDIHAQPPGDTAPDNNTLARAMLVRPYNDIPVTGDLDLTRILAGGTREATFMVSAGRRALATARFMAPHYLPGITVTSVRAAQGECRVDAAAGGICDFMDLAAGRARGGDRGLACRAACDQDVAVGVSTSGDVSP